MGMVADTTASIAATTATGAATITGAVIALCGLLIAGYLTNFVAEDFRRSREGSTIAAGLAGELSSYELAFPMLKENIGLQIDMLTRGRTPPFRAFEVPTDPLFDVVVGRLGLLGAKMVEDVVFTYQQIRAFRFSYSIISKEYQNMAPEELIRRLNVCVECLDRAADRWNVVVPALKKRAAERYQLPILGKVIGFFKSIKLD